MAAPQPSARLVRAVDAERAELERQRVRLTSEASELREALARIEHGLVEIDERRGLLDRLAAPAEVPAVAAVTDAESAASLRGPAIREHALRVLIDDGRESLHYREWFELLGDEGYAIAGKDPLAVFLTQITRSPAVRRGARAGVYELDREASARLRTTIDRLQHELRELTTTTEMTAADLNAIRARRTQLTAEIGRAERRLEEVARMFERTRALVAASA